MLDAGVVLTFQVMYIQVEVYHGISPNSRNETGRFLQIQRLKRHVQNVQNVGSDVSDEKKPQGEHEYVRQRKLKPAEPRFAAKDGSCREGNKNIYIH